MIEKVQRDLFQSHHCRSPRGLAAQPFDAWQFVNFLDQPLNTRIDIRFSKTVEDIRNAEYVEGIAVSVRADGMKPSQSGENQ